MSQGDGDRGDDATGETAYLLEELPVMYVLTRERDGEGIIEGCNQRFVDTLGYDRGDVVGRPITDLYAPESAVAADEGGYQRALEDEFTSEARELVRADGTVVHTLLRAVPRTEDGEVVGTRALFVDVTTREQRRQQAALLNRVIRHNLRNDMTVILGHASLLAGELDGDLGDSAAQIEATAHRWDDLIDKVQRLRRVASVDPDWERTDLADVLAGLERRLADAYPNAVLTFLRPQAGEVTVRPEAELALRELCENAITHTPDENPEVIVTVSTDGPWVELTVADDGPPIPDTELVPLTSGETSPLLHGTGLGLWTVRMAMDRVGGEVQLVQNDADGTIITIRYPSE
jgi:PAS domain S-box-containing protein